MTRLLLSRFRRSYAGVLAVIMLMTLAQPSAQQQFEVSCGEAVYEGADVTCKFRLPNAFNFKIRYAYKTEDGTATAGENYYAKEGYLVFDIGIQTAEIKIRTIHDVVAENSETFYLKLFDMQTQGLARDNDGWVSGFGVRGVPYEKTVQLKIKSSQGPRKPE